MKGEAMTECERFVKEGNGAGWGVCFRDMTAG